ncbi:unnamed protein product, partial [Polarella glacialis]
PNQTEMVGSIENRLAALADMDVTHLEPMNMVRYGPGQFFKTHHDGRFRPKTVFIYLNDLPPDDGGETLFPRLGFKVVPRRGCAVMWSNILGPQVDDQRLVHQGLPPKTSVKYGVNCFFNDKVMRRYQYHGADAAANPSPAAPSRGVSQAQTLDPVKIAEANPGAPALAAAGTPEGGLRICRLRVSQRPAVWLAPNILSSEEAGLLRAMVPDRSKASGHDGQSSSPSTASTDTLGGKAPSEEDSARERLLADLEPRLATAAGLGGEWQLEGRLEIRRRGPEAPGSQPSALHTKPSRSVAQDEDSFGIRRAVFLFLNDLPEAGGGELLFPQLAFQVRPREGCAVVWELGQQGGWTLEEGAAECVAMPALAGGRYGLSCVFTGRA